MTIQRTFPDEIRFKEAPSQLSTEELSLKEEIWGIMQHYNLLARASSHVEGNIEADRQIKRDLISAGDTLSGQIRSEDPLIPLAIRELQGAEALSPDKHTLCTARLRNPSVKDLNDIYFGPLKADVIMRQLIESFIGRYFKESEDGETPNEVLQTFFKGMCFLNHTDRTPGVKQDFTFEKKLDRLQAWFESTNRRTEASALDGFERVFKRHLLDEIRLLIGNENRSTQENEKLTFLFHFAAELRVNTQELYPKKRLSQELVLMEYFVRTVLYVEEASLAEELEEKDPEETSEGNENVDENSIMHTLNQLYFQFTFWLRNFISQDQSRIEKPKQNELDFTPVFITFELWIHQIGRIQKLLENKVPLMNVVPQLYSIFNSWIQCIERINLSDELKARERIKISGLISNLMTLMRRDINGQTHEFPSEIFEHWFIELQKLDFLVQTAFYAGISEMDDSQEGALKLREKNDRLIEMNYGIARVAQQAPDSTLADRLKSYSLSLVRSQQAANMASNRLDTQDKDQRNDEQRQRGVAQEFKMENLFTDLCSANAQLLWVADRHPNRGLARVLDLSPDAENRLNPELVNIYRKQGLEGLCEIYDLDIEEAKAIHAYYKAINLLDVIKNYRGPHVDAYIQRVIRIGKLCARQDELKEMMNDPSWLDSMSVEQIKAQVEALTAEKEVLLKDEKGYLGGEHELGSAVSGNLYSFVRQSRELSKGGQDMFYQFQDVIGFGGVNTMGLEKVALRLMKLASGEQARDEYIRSYVDDKGFEYQRYRQEIPTVITVLESDDSLKKELDSLSQSADEDGSEYLRACGFEVKKQTAKAKTFTTPQSSLINAKGGDELNAQGQMTVDLSQANAYIGFESEVSAQNRALTESGYPCRVSASVVVGFELKTEADAALLAVLHCQAEKDHSDLKKAVAEHKQNGTGEFRPVSVNYYSGQALAA